MSSGNHNNLIHGAETNVIKIQEGKLVNFESSKSFVIIV